MTSNKNKKGVKVAAWILVALQAAASAFLVAMLIRFDLVPENWLNLIVVGLTVLVGISAVCACFRKAAAAGIVTAILFGSVCCLGGYYVNITQKALSEMMNQDGSSNISVLSRSAEALSASGKLGTGKMAVVDELIDPYIQAAELEASKEWRGVEFVPCTTYNEALEALRSGTVDAILFDEGMREFMEEYYETFELETSVIKVFAIPDSVAELPEESEPDSEPDSEPEESGEESGGVEIDDYDIPEGCFVVYLSGSDSRSKSRPGTKGRSDVNILAVVNPNTMKVLLISTPRDSYVELYNVAGPNNKDKLTHLGSYGVDYVAKTLGNLYGVKVDYIARIGFTGFINAVDAIGGIDVMSLMAFETYEGESGKSKTWKFEAGLNHLNGEEALAFARERHAFYYGDFQRGKNQMAVITALVDKVTSPEILVKYASLLEAVQPQVYMTVPTSLIKGMVKITLDGLSAETPKRWRVYSFGINGGTGMAYCYRTGFPTETNPDPQKLSVVYPSSSDIATAKKLIKQLLNGQTPEVP